MLSMKTGIYSYLFTAFLWTFVVVTALPVFTLYLLIWLLAAPWDRDRTVAHYFCAVWAGMYIAVNPAWKLTIEHKERIDRKKTYVFISNHQSLLDIPILMQLYLHFRWVSKIEFLKVPVLGWVIRMNRYIPVKRGDKESADRMYAACKKTLQDGISVYMFPEGTRTEDGHLGAFKDGAFILAKENQVPLQPVVLDGAREALPKKGLLIKGKQHFIVRVMQEIPVEKINNLSLPQLSLYARDLMAGELASMRQHERE